MVSSNLIPARTGTIMSYSINPLLLWRWKINTNVQCSSELSKIIWQRSITNRPSTRWLSVGHYAGQFVVSCLPLLLYSTNSIVHRYGRGTNRSVIGIYNGHWPVSSASPSGQWPFVYGPLSENVIVINLLMIHDSKSKYLLCCCYDSMEPSRSLQNMFDREGLFKLCVHNYILFFKSGYVLPEAHYS